MPGIFLATKEHKYYKEEAFLNAFHVDLVFDSARQLVPVEIKAAMTCNPDFLRGILPFQKTVPTAVKGAVIYSGELQPDLEAASVLNFKRTGKLFQ